MWRGRQIGRLRCAACNTLMLNAFLALGNFSASTAIILMLSPEKVIERRFMAVKMSVSMS
eukprot:SAG25_NODE_10852_length_321_cov_0.923423_1_plen_59_part_10